MFLGSWFNLGVILKKVIYTLNINYSKEITNLTYPLMEKYASKIGAEFKIISSRMFPDFPIVYEKLQIYELGKTNDWNIYIDGDTIIHPELFDITDHIEKDTVLHNGADMAAVRWKYDNYFRRDGRNIGSCNWFTVASNWCIDLWKPLDDLTLEQALSNIFPTVNELRTVVTREHLIDDYVLSRNIAKFGLKYTTLKDLLQKLDPSGNFLWHQYTITLEDKIKQIREVLKNWNLDDTVCK